MSQFTTTLAWKPGTQEAQLSCAGKPDITITAPPEFGGNDATWSPEEALVGAVESCLLLTTLYFVNQMKIGLLAYKSSASGDMAKTPQGLRFTALKVTIEATLASADDVDTMQRAVDQAERFCPVSAAVGVPISVSLKTALE